MPIPGRPRLTDVADRAGVSLKTASRALNDEYGVAPETAARVRDAARELGFRPNRLARSLAAGHASPIVGLLIPNVSDPFVAALVGGAEQVLAAHDLQLITASHRDDPDLQRALATALIEHRVQALILMSAPGPVDYLAPDPAHGLVITAVDRPLAGVEADCVTVDNAAGAREATARLIGAGHRRIGTLALDLRLWTVAARVAAFRAAMAEHDLPLDDRDIIVSADPAIMEEALAQRLSGPAAPTAVFATGHISGRAAMRAARRSVRGLEIAVFDSMDDTDLLAHPPRVIVETGPERIGRLAATLTVDRLDGLVAAPRRVTLPPVVAEPTGIRDDRAPTLAER